MEAASDVRDTRPGLRERKKRRTRETIARVALELFAEHGFHETTLRQIAEAADVAPRTVSAYFPVKEELVFPEVDAVFSGLEHRLESREPGETAIEALRAWIATVLASDEIEMDKTRRRRELIESEVALRNYERAIRERAERAIAAAVAVDLGLPADDLIPGMVGAATMAALDALGRAAHDSHAPPNKFRREALAVIDEAMAFIGAGVRGLQAGADRRAGRA